MATDSGSYTPETIARRLKMAEAMLDTGGNPQVQHWAQGLNELAKGYVGGRMFNRAEGMEKEGRKAANDALIQLLMPGGGGAQPGTMPSAGTPAAQPPAAPAGLGPQLAAMGIRPQDGSSLFRSDADKAVEDQSAATMADPTNPIFTGTQPGQGGPKGELGAAIVQHATAAGLDPKDVATAMSYETGGTLDPWKRGPTTKWGTHRGLIQWGEPQATQYGVTKDTPVGEQVKAAVKYLQDRGVQPGHGLMQIYSAINAGGVGPQFERRSDAAAGGAPGTVADKVNGQMSGHRRVAEQLIAGAGSGPTAPWQMPPAQQSAFEAQPQGAPPAGPPPQAAPQAPPQAGATNPRQQIATMLSNPNPFVQRMGQQMAQQMIQKQMLGSEETNDTKEYNRAVQQGFKGTLFDYQKQLKEAGKPVTNINQQQESEFNKESGKLQAKRFDEMVQGGQTAGQMISDVSALRDIGSRITTGKTAEIAAALGPYAEALGIKIDGLGDMQAYNAIVSRLAPQMRVSGSGATSDFEMKKFLEALPGLGKTPEGNEIISKTFEAIQQHKIAAADIASRAITGDLTRQEAEKQLRALPNPLELWKKTQGKAPTASPAAKPSIDDLIKKYGG